MTPSDSAPADPTMHNTAAGLSDENVGDYGFLDDRYPFEPSLLNATLIDVTGYLNQGQVREASIQRDTTCYAQRMPVSMRAIVWVLRGLRGVCRLSSGLTKTGITIAQTAHFAAAGTRSLAVACTASADIADNKGCSAGG